MTSTKTQASPRSPWVL